MLTDDLTRPESDRRLAVEMMRMLQEIMPFRRSVAGSGVRETLRYLAGQIPLEISEVPSGTRVLDWEIPLEWRLRSAYIADSSGRRIVDAANNPLHVVSHSIPIHARLSLAQLRSNLHTLSDYPDWIPHRTSYYKRDWGFCAPDRLLKGLRNEEYEVLIDADLWAGALSIGECFLRGETSREFVVFTHTCHPGLCNDGASGIVVAATLAKFLLDRRRRLSYRIVFAPTTIGSIAWLARNEHRLDRVHAGLVVGLAGDQAPLTYKRSRQGYAEIDLVSERVVRGIDPAARILDFAPVGYDERQFCSPGFNLPFGRLTRSIEGEYPEYHTSADDQSLISPAALVESLHALARITSALDGDTIYERAESGGEPQLGRRNIFRAIGGGARNTEIERALFWVLNASDGRHGLEGIIGPSGLSIEVLAEAAALLRAHGLIREARERT